MSNTTIKSVGPRFSFFSTSSTTTQEAGGLGSELGMFSGKHVSVSKPVGYTDGNTISVIFF